MCVRFTLLPRVGACVRTGSTVMLARPNQAGHRRRRSRSPGGAPTSVPARMNTRPEAVKDKDRTRRVPGRRSSRERATRSSAILGANRLPVRSTSATAPTGPQPEKRSRPIQSWCCGTSSSRTDRSSADHLAVKLAMIGRKVAPASPDVPIIVFTDSELEQLAQLTRALVQGTAPAGLAARSGPRRRHQDAPGHVPWSKLPEHRRQIDRDHVQAIPGILATVGSRIVHVRHTTTAASPHGGDRPRLYFSKARVACQQQSPHERSRKRARADRSPTAEPCKRHRTYYRHSGFRLKREASKEDTPELVALRALVADRAVGWRVQAWGVSGLSRSGRSLGMLFASSVLGALVKRRHGLHGQ